MNQKVSTAVLFLSLVVSIAATSVANDDDLKSKVNAPDNTVRVGSTLGGAYFVDKNLVKRSAALKSQLVSIREKILRGDIDGAEALKQLEEIESKLSQIAQEIEAQKVLVSAFNVYTKKETVELPLGEEGLVIINGDKVRIRPWDGVGVKCVLEKTILAKSQPDDSEFSEIKLVHDLGTASEMVGRTTEERKRDEAKFLASEDGRKLTEKQIADRQKFLQEQIYGPKQKFAPFQGKESTQLRLGGLKGKEGNRQVHMEIESKSGESSHSSKWQRHAMLTVFLPKCNWVLVRGCQTGVDISGIESNLILTTQGSHQRDYEGSFSVTKVSGDIVIDQAPIRELVDITGSIEYTATYEFVNSGINHEGGTRTARAYETARTVVRNVSGDVQAHFVRTNLEMGNIGGAIDIQNEFGDSRLVLGKAFDKASSHRIVSESGEIELTGESEIFSRIALYAHTQTGILHTNLKRDVLSDISFSTGAPRLGWRGFVTPGKERFSFDKFERPQKALSNQKRKPGLDLISRGGRVSILVD